MDNVIKKIIDKQVELEMNNTEFARFLGTSRQWVINIHNNNAKKSPFKFKTMCILAHACGLSIEELKDYNKRLEGK